MSLISLSQKLLNDKTIESLEWNVELWEVICLTHHANIQAKDEETF